MLTAAALEVVGDKTLNGWRQLLDEQYQLDAEKTDGLATGSAKKDRRIPESHQQHAKRVMSLLHSRMMENKEQAKIEMLRLVSVLAPGDKRSAYVLLDKPIRGLSEQLPERISIDWKFIENSLSTTVSYTHLTLPTIYPV